MSPPLRTPAASGPPLNKQALLAWAAEASGKACTRLDDLKSGVVLLHALHSVFPALNADRRYRVCMRLSPLSSPLMEPLSSPLMEPLSSPRFS